MQHDNQAHLEVSHETTSGRGGHDCVGWILRRAVRMEVKGLIQEGVVARREQGKYRK